MSEGIKNVVCLGASAMDIVVNGLDHFPEESERAEARAITLQIGGSAVIPAMALKTLFREDANIRLVAPIGERLLGRYMRHSLSAPIDKGWGVDCVLKPNRPLGENAKGSDEIQSPQKAETKIKPRFSTPVSIAHIGENRSPAFIHAAHGNAQLSYDDLNSAPVLKALKTADWLHIAGLGILPQLEGRGRGGGSVNPAKGGKRMRTWIAKCRKANPKLKISVNACCVTGWDKDMWLKVLRDWIGMVDHLALSVWEADQFVHKTPLLVPSSAETVVGDEADEDHTPIDYKALTYELWRLVKQQKIKGDPDDTLVSVTAGSEGAYYYNKSSGGDTNSRRAYVTERVRDTIGAGDIWCGAAIYAALSGMGTDDMIAFANAAASISVEHSSPLSLDDRDDFTPEKIARVIEKGDVIELPVKV